jgi:hypothetical protein
VGFTITRIAQSARKVDAPRIMLAVREQEAGFTSIS